MLSLLVQTSQSRIKLFFFLRGYLLLPFNTSSNRSLEDLFLLLLIVLQLLLFGGFDEILRFIHEIEDFAIGRDSDNLNVAYFLEMMAEFGQIFPLSVIELQKLLFLDEFVIQFFEKLGLPRIFGLDMLNESPFELFGSLFDMFKRIGSKIPDPQLMAGGVDVTFETVLVFALLAAEFAEVFQSPGGHELTIMNNNNIVLQVEEEVAKIRREVHIEAQELVRLLNDRKKLMDRVEQYNERAVMCISNQKWENGLVYLAEAEQLLESAAAKGHLVDRCLVQCILHNEANCYQNLWQLEQCSNYIQALIFNMNSRNKSLTCSPQVHPPGKEPAVSKIGLAQYYLQFCAINSQLGNHSGALVSARKALQLIRNELKEWKRVHEKNDKGKGRAEWQQKLRLLNLVCTFNDSINIHMQQVLQEGVAYFLKIWRMNASNTKSNLKDAKDFIDGFTIKSVMQIQCINYENCLNIFERESDMSLLSVLERIMILSTCYFTMATELRLISLKKSRQSNSDKYQLPQFKQSEIHHLLAIALLALTLTVQSTFLNHLLISYQNHYSADLLSKDVPFKKLFNEVIFVKEAKDDKRNHEASIELSEQDEAISSHISKPGRTMVRITKGSKQSERDNKFSLIDPDRKKSKSKKKKSKSKNNKKQSPTIKYKGPRPSVSKSPQPKTPKHKDSLLMRSPRSKETIPSVASRTIIPSIKHISSPFKLKLSPLSGNKNSDKQKGNSKTKKKIKTDDNNLDDYFMIRKKDDKKTKKTSVSSKKNHSQSRSTSRLPINSTLETKDAAVGKDKKPAKRSILQHYL